MIKYRVVLNPTSVEQQIGCRQLATDHNCSYSIDRHVADSDGNGLVSMIALNWLTATSIMRQAVHTHNIKAGVSIV